jgi:DNA-nicking Smr family endonuclease
MRRRKRVEPIPEEFRSYEEAAEFWDTHETTDYPEAFRTVNVRSELRRRRYEIEIDEDLMRPLRAQARRRKVTPSNLASDILRQRLAISE